MGVIAFMLSTAYAQPQEAEARIKAAVIYNMARFVEWPSDLGELDFCVTGNSLLSDQLRSLDGKTISGRMIYIHRRTSVDDMVGCELAFLHSDVLFWAPMLPAGVLTVGDDPGFMAEGGMLQLVQKGGKIRFRVNLKAVTAAELKVSSKLLQLADEVIR